MHSKHVRFLNNPLQFKIKNQNAVRRLMLLLFSLAYATRVRVEFIRMCESAVVRAYSVSFGLINTTRDKWQCDWAGKLGSFS